MARILLLDDDARTRDALTHRLEEAGHEVRIAAGCSMACRHNGPREWRPDVILVELVCTERNGFTLAASLATSSSSSGSTPVLLMSDRGLRDDEQWARARGVHGVVDRRNGGQHVLSEIDIVLKRERQAGTVTDNGAHVVGEGLSGAAMDGEAWKRSSLLQSTHCMPAASEGSAGEGGCDSSPVGPLIKALLQQVNEWLEEAELLSNAREGGIRSWKQRCCQWLAKLAWLLDLLPENARMPESTVPPDHEWEDAEHLVGMLLAWQRRLQSATRSEDRSASWRLILEQPLEQFVRQLQQLDQLDQSVAPKPISPDGPTGASIGSPVEVKGLSRATQDVECLKARGRNLLYAVLASRAAGCLPDDQIHVASVTLLGILHGEHDYTAALSNRLVDVIQGSHVADCPHEAAEPLEDCSYLEFIQAWREAPRVTLFQCIAVEIYRLTVLARLRQMSVRTRALLCSLHYSATSCLTSNEIYRQEANEVVRLLHGWNNSQAGLEWRIAALECRIASNLPDEEARLSLSSGLYHLPRPDTLAKEDRASWYRPGPLRSELMGELEMLVAGARELGVQKVEALAALLLACHRAMGGLVEPNRFIGVILRIAHWRLCRLLDQAAAWQRTDGISQIVAQLSRLLEYCSDNAVGGRPLKPSPDGPSAGKGAVKDSGKEAKQDFDAEAARNWNHRMTTLVYHALDLRDCRGLLLEMLLCQRSELSMPSATFGPEKAL